MVDQILRALQATLPKRETFEGIAREATPAVLRPGWQAPTSLLDVGAGYDASESLLDLLSLGTLPALRGINAAGAGFSEEYGQPALGALLGAKAAAAQPARQVVRQAADLIPNEWAADRASNLMQGAIEPIIGAGVSPNVPAPETLSREALAEYWRANARDIAGTAGEFVAREAGNPLNFIPVGRVGRLAREAAPALKAAGGGRAMLGTALDVGGKLGLEYQKGAEEIVPAGLRALREGSTRLPVVGAGIEWLSGPSGRSLLNRHKARMAQALGSVVQGLPSKLGPEGEEIPATMRDFLQPRGTTMPKGKRQWGWLQEGLTELEDATAALEGPERLAGGARLLNKVADDKNLIDAAAARDISDARRATLLDKNDPAYLAPDEFEAYKNARYQRQGEEQAALQFGLQNALENLRDAPFPKPRGRLSPEGEFIQDPAQAATHAEAKRLMDEGLGRMRQEVFGKRAMVKTAEEMWEPLDPTEFDAFEGASDTFYRAGRAAAAATADQLAGDIVNALPGGLDEASEKMIQGSMGVYLGDTAAMLRLTAPLEERLGPVSRDASEYIAGQADQLRAAGRKVEALYNQISRLSTSILREAYQPNGVRPTTVGSVNDRVARALENSRTLTQALEDADKAWRAKGLPGRAADIEKVKKLLVSNIADGDVLLPGDWLQLTTNKWGKTLGPAFGVNPPSPWLSALSGVMNVWRGSALLSPRFQAANLVFGLFANDRAGVSAAETAKNLGRNLSHINQQIMDRFAETNENFDPAHPGMRGTFDAYMSAMFDQTDYKPGVTGGGATLMQKLGRIDANGAATYAGQGQAAAGAQEFADVFGRGPGAAVRNAAILGGAGAVGGAMLPAEDDAARNENIVRGAFGGAAVGGVSPQLGWAAKLFFNAIEEALRKTAVHTAMKPAMVGAHEGVITAMRGVKPREVETISRRVTRGGRDVETAEQLFGKPVPVVVPPGSTRPAQVSGALGASRAGLLASPLSDDAKFALIRLQRARERVEALERAGDPGAAAARAQYAALVGEIEPLTRAAPSPTPLAPDPWYEPIAGQRPSAAEAARAQRRADIEQLDRRFASMAQADADIAEAEALLAEKYPFIRSGPGGDPGERIDWNMTVAHRMSDEDRKFLLDLYDLRENVHMGWSARDDLEPMAADLPDLSLSPGRIEARPQTGPVLKGDIPGGSLEALEQWMRSRVVDDPASELNGIMLATPREIAEEAIEAGIDPKVANEIGGLWDGAIRQGEDAGLALANRIHGDYGDVSRLTEFLRRTGMFPFITWSVKMAPQVATWIVQDPRLLIAIDRMNNLTEEEIDAAGLPARFDRLGKLGMLGDALAEHVLGRPDATLMGNVLGAVFPYAEYGKIGSRREAAAPGFQRPPLQDALDIAGALGAGPGPIPSLIGRATGLTEDYGSPIFRLSSYAEALSGLGGGNQVNPEQLDIQMIRALREGVTGKRQPTITGNPTLDYAVRARIAETAYEKTGRPASGDYRKAMDDPKSAIWKTALREVQRERAGQMVIGSTLPFRTKRVSELEEVAAAAAARSGTRTADLAGLTDEEVTARFRGAEPEARIFWGLGGTEEQTAKRQLSAYIEEQKRWKGMDPRRAYALRTKYLEDKPLLARYLAERQQTPQQPASARR